MRKQQVIVSLTSFPAAIPFAIQAIRSILDGSVLPDRIVLYLTALQFPNGVIPSELAELTVNSVFEVRFYNENIRSYTKLIPALKDFPDDIIITVDDDVWYHKNMLKLLLRYHKKYPGTIIGHRVRRIDRNVGYNAWKVCKRHRYFTRSVKPSFRNMQTGVGGVLYPPRSLSADMLDCEVFMKMAPTVDDVWFWAAAVANGTRIAPVPFGFWRRINLDKPSELSLKNTNIHSGVDVNRTVLESIIEKYPIIRQRFASES